MKLISTKGLLMMSMIALIISSCKKDDNSTTFDESTATEVQTTDDISMDLFDQIKIASTTNASLQPAASVATQSTTTSSCAVVTVSPDGNIWPKNVTIDFGTGCTNEKGITHKGKILATYTRPWYEKDATITLTLDHFFVDSVQIDGTKKFTSHGLNTQDGTFSFTVNVDGAKITDHGTATWSSERTITWNAADYSYSVNGWVKGTTKKGIEYTANTTKDLVKKIDCRWISQGTIEINAAGASATIDYGKGDCDDKATLTINGHTKEITIRKNK